MTAERWSEVKSIVARALERPESHRQQWLNSLNLADAEIVDEVRRLVAQTKQDNSLLEAGAGQRRKDPVDGATAFIYQPGQVLADRFEILNFLGSGGMGEVYAALDRDLGEPIALKTLHSEYSSQPVFIARLKKEVQIARRLQHPNLCRVHDIHRIPVEDGREGVVLTMELLRGETLSQYIGRAGTIEWPEALTIVRQVVAGLEIAHAAGILHRDLKGSNIMLVPGADNIPRAVITDFGLAREISGSHDTQSLFGLNAVVGTPAYMAPEQLRGEGVSTSSDIYGLGVVAFEMVTGRLPFEGETALAITLRRLEQLAPSPKVYQPRLPSQWDFAIQACLSRSPKDRPRSCLEFLNILEGNQGAIQFWLRRHRRRTALTTLVLSACTAIGYFVPFRSPSHSPGAIASYKRGEEFVRRRNSEGIQNALQEFRNALAVEPTYAEAWAGLADAYCAAVHYDFMEPKLARVEAEKAAKEALRLNGRLGKAEGVLAYVNSIDLKRWRFAEPSFRKAIELDPNEPLPHAWYAAYLGRLGRFDDAIAQARRAVDIEPGFFYLNHQLAAEYFRAGRIPEYYRQSLDLVRLQPFEASAHLSLARACEWLGRYEEALRHCDDAAKYGENITTLCFRGTIEAARGNHAQAAQIARQVEDYWQQKPFEAHILVNLYAKLGQFDKVLDILDQAYERGDSTVLACPTSLYLQPMKSMQRYQAFLRKLGFDQPSALVNDLYKTHAVGFISSSNRGSSRHPNVTGTLYNRPGAKRGP